MLLYSLWLYFQDSEIHVVYSNVSHFGFGFNKKYYPSQGKRPPLTHHHYSITLNCFPWRANLFTHILSFFLSWFYICSAMSIYEIIGSGYEILIAEIKKWILLPRDWSQDHDFTSLSRTKLSEQVLAHLGRLSLSLQVVHLFSSFWRGSVSLVAP